MKSKKLEPVLHVITGDMFAGAERVQSLLREALPQFGYECHFSCLKEGKFQRDLMKLGNTRSPIMGGRSQVLKAAQQIRVHAEQVGAKIVHSHTVRSALVSSLATRQSSLRFVHHVHSNTKLDTHKVGMRLVNGFVEALVLKRAEKLISVSSSLEDHLLDQGYPPDKLITVLNGVGTQNALQGVANGKQLRLGVMAMFRPRKGLEVLLHALASDELAGCPIELDVIGGFEEDSYRQKMHSLAADLDLSDRVNWLGFQDDVQAALAPIDLLVLPSLYGEGMPMVLLEAMAMGVPVVASGIDGIPQLVRDQIDGLLVPPKDVFALSEAIRSLADNPKRRLEMGVQARERQQTAFSAESMALRVSEVYDEILSA